METENTISSVSFFNVGDIEMKSENLLDITVKDHRNRNQEIPLKFGLESLSYSQKKIIRKFIKHGRPITLATDASLPLVFSVPVYLPGSKFLFPGNRHYVSQEADKLKSEHRRKCANCSNQVELKKCNKCKIAKYCGVECQKEQWYNRGHKAMCVFLEQFERL